MQNYFSFLLFCADCHFIQNTETKYTKTFCLMLSKNFFCVQTKVKVSTPSPLLYTTLYMNNLSPNLYLFCNLHFNQHFLTFHLNKIQDKSKNKIRRKIYFIMFGGLRKKTCMFFYKKHFHKPWATSSWDLIRINGNLSYQKEWRENETFWMKELLSWGKSIIAKRIQTLPIRTKAYPF